MLTNLGIGGLGVGVFLAPKIIAKFQLRKVLFMSTFLNIFACLLKICFVFFPTIIAGRLLFGTGCGILGFIFGKCFNESIDKNN